MAKRSKVTIECPECHETKLIDISLDVVHAVTDQACIRIHNGRVSLFDNETGLTITPRWILDRGNLLEGAQCCACTCELNVQDVIRTSEVSA